MWLNEPVLRQVQDVSVGQRLAPLTCAQHTVKPEDIQLDLWIRIPGSKNDLNSQEKNFYNQEITTN